MIEAYYNLKRTPFAKDIHPENIFISQSIAELNRRLEYIKEKKGMFLITGNPGTGKTLLIRTFLHHLNQNFFKYFYIPLATVNILDFYRQLCTTLGGEPLWKKSQLFASIQTTIKDYVENEKKSPLLFLTKHIILEMKIFMNYKLLQTSI